MKRSTGFEFTPYTLLQNIFFEKCNYLLMLLFASRINRFVLEVTMWLVKIMLLSYYAAKDIIIRYILIKTKTGNCLQLTGTC